MTDPMDHPDRDAELAHARAHLERYHEAFSHIPGLFFVVDADSVVLKNLYGEVVDAVHYDKFSGWPVPKGASLQLAHPNLDNDDPVFWSASTEPYGDKGNSGTPGLLP